MPRDDKTYNPLRGGIQGEVESSSAVAGTLGCLAETNKPGEQKKIVFLSVAHLLYGGRAEKVLGPITQTGSRACHTNACSKCSRCCSNDIGRSLRGEFSPEIDAAIATIYTGLRYIRDVEGLGAIRGPYTITAADAHGTNARYHVRKRGIATRLTDGTVRLLDFATDTKTDDDEFKRRAVKQLLIQPRALVEVPITEIRADGVIQAVGAKFVTNHVTQEHFVEISGPTRNRELYKVHHVISEDEIVVSRRTSKRPATLVPQHQPNFTAVDGFFNDATSGVNGVRAPGLRNNNPDLQPFDLAEIKGSTANNGIFQLRALGAGVITPQDEIGLYEHLTIEAAGSTEVRGLIYLRVRNEKFNDAADSGSVLVNDSNEVVGLLAGKVEMDGRPDLLGYGFGAPIQPVLDRLGISIPIAAAPGQEQVVSATEGEPPPGGIVALAERHEERALLLRAHDELLATEPGRTYAELTGTHRREVQTLIDTNRRVAVAWQRNGGPLFFQLALNAVQHPDVAIPREINGRSLDACVTNILQVLDEHGSVSLRSDIAKFGHVWKLLPGMSFNELKRTVKHG